MSSKIDFHQWSSQLYNPPKFILRISSHPLKPLSVPRLSRAISTCLTTQVPTTQQPPTLHALFDDMPPHDRPFYMPPVPHVSWDGHSPWHRQPLPILNWSLTPGDPFAVPWGQMPRNELLEDMAIDDTDVMLQVTRESALRNDRPLYPIRVPVRRSPAMMYTHPNTIDGATRASLAMTHAQALGINSPLPPTRDIAHAYRMLNRNYAANLHANQQRQKDLPTFEKALQELARSHAHDEPNTEREECLICRENACMATTACGHSFCRYCVKQWLREEHTCPMCRKSVYDPSTRPPKGAPLPLWAKHPEEIGEGVSLDRWGLVWESWMDGPMGELD